MEDHAIVRRVLDGETGAYRLLVERYQDRVYNLVLRIVRAPSDAEEVTSDVFFRAYQKLDAFEFRSQFFTWIYRIAVNRASDRLDQKKRERAGSLDDLPAEPGGGKAGAGDPVRSAEDREFAEALRAALDTLDPRFREVMILREQEGLAYDEIAKVLGCSIGTVESRLFRAREKLREKLKRFA